MTINNFHIYLAASLILIACQSEDNLHIQHPDDYGMITFSARTEQPITRATDGYESYDATRHPATMGVFGYHDMTSASVSASPADLSMLFNVSMNYDITSKNWKYTNKKDEKYWADFAHCKTFDFVAYMPYREGVTFSKATDLQDGYVLSFDVPAATTATSASSDGITTLPILTDSRYAPIISHVPVHESQDIIDTKEKIHFLFDQTLTGYNVQFQIDPSMNAIRHFRIKDVHLYGDALPAGGKVSRAYSWDAANSLWSAAEIKWSDIQRVTITKENAVPIAFADNSGNNDTEKQYYDTGTKTLIATSGIYRKWGSDFYAIPDASFNPVIEVTYDVELSKDGKVTTRENVTSRITFSKINFDSIKAGLPGHVNAIRILIKPRYLYVLADEDKAEGLLLVDEQ